MEPSSPTMTAKFPWQLPRLFWRRAENLNWQGDDRLAIALSDDLAPGRYTIAVAVFLDGNSLTPSLGLLHFEVGG